MITCKTIERARTPNAEQDSAGDSAGKELMGKNSAADNIVDTVTLDETDRHRRRLLLTSDSGIEFLLELQSVTLLKHGDVLRLSDQRGIRVHAMPEALYEVRGNNPAHLLTLTWHIGNRHLASQIAADHVRIRHDPVIRNMLEQLGAQITDIQAGFDPEGGAYGDAPSGHHHAHDHHAHDHHAHDHE